MDPSGVNLTAIAFPSDKLTVGMLRRLYPARLDVPLPTFFDSTPYDNSAAYVLGNVLAKERALAMNAYNRAAGEGWKEIAPAGSCRRTRCGGGYATTTGASPSRCW